MCTCFRGFSNDKLYSIKTLVLFFTCSWTHHSNILHEDQNLLGRAFDIITLKFGEQDENKTHLNVSPIELFPILSH